MHMAILRVEKVKSFTELRARARHNTREHVSDNVDPARIGMNRTIGQSTADDVVKFTKQKIQECKDRGQTIRSDAVLAVEYVMTASPEWWQSATPAMKKSFIQNSYDWLVEQHGKENITSVFFHRDETTEHLHAFIVPVDPEKKLNCKHYLGGPSKMKGLQDSFAKKMGVLGLYRGVTGSKVKHTTLKEFAKAMNKPTPQPTKVDMIKAAVGMKADTVDALQQQAKFAGAIALTAAAMRQRQAALDKREVEVSRLAADAALSQSTRERMQKEIDRLTRDNEALLKKAGVTNPANQNALSFNR